MYFVIIPMLCGIGAFRPAISQACDARSLESADANLVLLDVIADRIDNAASRGGGTQTPWLRGGLQWQGDALDIVRGYAALGASWEPTERTAMTLAYGAQRADRARVHIAQIGFSIGL